MILQLNLALLFGILPFILANDGDDPQPSRQGPASAQNAPENNTAPSWTTLSMLDGLSFVHHYDAFFQQNAQANDRDSRIWNFPTKSMRAEIYFQNLRDKLLGWNQKLDKIEKEAIVEEGQALIRVGELTGQQLDHARQKLKTIALIYRIQNLTIGHYFLSEFLNYDGFQHQRQLAVRKLELKGKSLDLERYEQKMKRYKADMEDVENMLKKKLRKKRWYEPEKEIFSNFDYNYIDYLDTLVDLKNTLEEAQVIWMTDDIQEVDQFWTTDLKMVDESRMCTICMTQERQIAFGPCGHIATCEKCSDKLKDKTNLCPLCRKEITFRMRIFLP